MQTRSRMHVRLEAPVPKGFETENANAADSAEGFKSLPPHQIPLSYVRTTTETEWSNR